MTGCMATTPRLNPDLKAAITAAIRAIPMEECGESSRTLPAGSKCACSAGSPFGAHFLSASETKSFRLETLEMSATVPIQSRPFKTDHVHNRPIHNRPVENRPLSQLTMFITDPFITDPFVTDHVDNGPLL